MRWGTDTVSELRTAFVHAARTAGRPVARAAEDFGISRKTTYKWLAPHDAGGPQVLMFPTGEVKCRERLGGLLKHYYRAAA
jgi:hypothetical protein